MHYQAPFVGRLTAGNHRDLLDVKLIKCIKPESPIRTSWTRRTFGARNHHGGTETLRHGDGTAKPQVKTTNHNVAHPPSAATAGAVEVDGISTDTNGEFGF